MGFQPTVMAQEEPMTVEWSEGDAPRNAPTSAERLEEEELPNDPCSAEDMNEANCGSCKKEIPVAQRCIALCRNLARCTRYALAGERMCRMHLNMQKQINSFFVCS